MSEGAGMRAGPNAVRGADQPATGMQSRIHKLSSFNGATAELAARAEAIADRLSPVPRDSGSKAGPTAVPAGLFGEFDERAQEIERNLSRLAEALGRLDGMI